MEPGRLNIRYDRRAWMLGLAIGLLLSGVGQGDALFGRAASAQVDRSDKKKAKQLMAQGKRMFKKGRYTQAIEAFKEAYKHWPRHEIQFNIAYSYAKLGEKTLAVTHLRVYLAKATASQKRKLPPLLIKMQQQVGVLVVVVPDPDADIYVDGRLAGKGRIEKIVEVGSRAVEIRKGERTLVSKSLDVLPGTEKVWELSKLPGEPGEARPREKTTTKVISDPGRGEPVRPPVTPPPPAKKGLHWAFFAAAAGLALAAGAVAIGTGMKTLKLRKDYEDNPTKSTMDQGNTMRRVTNGMIGVAAGAAAAAVVVIFFTRWRSGKETGKITVLPEITPKGVGLSLSLPLGSSPSP